MEKNTVLEYLEERESKMIEKAKTTRSMKWFYDGKAEAYHDIRKWVISQPESPAPLSAEEIEKAVRQMDMTIVALALSIPQDVWTDVKANWLTAKEALLSQRQSVAPEREEERMSAASQWFDGLSDGKRQHYIDAFPRLTVRGLYEQVMSETSASAENKGASGSADGLSKKGGEG